MIMRVLQLLLLLAVQLASTSITATSTTPPSPSSSPSTTHQSDGLTLTLQRTSVPPSSIIRTLPNSLAARNKFSHGRGDGGDDISSVAKRLRQGMPFRPPFARHALDEKMKAAVSGESYLSSDSVRGGDDGGGAAVARKDAGAVSLLGEVIGLGEFVATVRIGSGQQEFLVQVDTGSSSLAVYDRACKDCNAHRHRPYEAALSSTFEEVSCGEQCQVCATQLFEDEHADLLDECAFSLRYLDESGVSGVLGNDTVGIGSAEAMATFGRIVQETEAFAGYEVDGILGVGMTPLNCNPTCFPTVLDQLHSEAGIDQVHAMCLTPEGGIWDVGYVNEARVAPDSIKYADLSDSREYAVALDSFTVGGRSIDVGDVDAIIDSGTTLAYMSEGLLDEWEAATLAINDETPLPGLIELNSTGCAFISEAEADEWPGLVFNFSNATVTLRGSQYLMQVPGYGRCFVLSSVEGLPDSYMLLGDVFMQAAYVVFDPELKRIGFSDQEVDCPVPHPFGELARQVHTSYGSDATRDLTVNWNTLMPSINSAVSVQGTSTDMYGLSVPLTEYSWQHWVSVDLARVLNESRDAGIPTSQLEYSCDSNTKFPLPLPASVPFTVAVMGNLGLYGGSADISSVAALRTRFRDDYRQLGGLIHLGNLADGLDTRNGSNADAFLEWLSPLVAQVPYMVTPGHLELTPAGFAQFSQRFAMPGYGTTHLSNLYYTWTSPSVRWISLCSECFFADGYDDVLARQELWLDQLLQASNQAEARAEFPFIVVYTHRPMYGDESGMTSPAHRQYMRLESLFYDWGVDLVLGGHAHYYERFLPMYNNTFVQNVRRRDPYLDPAAPVYIVDGAAGDAHGLEAEASSDERPEGSVTGTKSVAGFGLLTVVNSTTLLWRRVNAAQELIDGYNESEHMLDYDNDLTLIDHVVLRRTLGVYPAFGRTPNPPSTDPSDEEKTSYQWSTIGVVAISVISLTGLVLIVFGARRARKRLLEKKAGNRHVRLPDMQLSDNEHDTLVTYTIEDSDDAEAPLDALDFASDDDVVL